MSKKRFSAVGEWDGPEYPELAQIESAVNSLRAQGVAAYYGRADDEPYIPPEPPPVTVPMSKGGVHIHSGNREGYGDYLRLLTDAGKPVSLVKVVAGGSFGEAKDVSPLTTTIYRTPIDSRDFPEQNWHYDSSETCKANAIWWLDRCYPIWQLNPSDYYELTNEPNPDNHEQVSWFIEWTMYCMIKASVDGFKLGIGGFSSGTPSETFMAEMIGLLNTCAASGHIVCVHDGAVQDPLYYQQNYQPGSANSVLRYRYWIDLLRSAGKRVPRFAITEGYAYGNKADPYYWSDWAWYLRELNKDPECIGTAWFTLGDWGNTNVAGKPLMKYAELQAGL